MAPTTRSISELADLLGGTLLNAPDPDLEINAVVSSGDHDQPGCIYVAYEGVSVDGHDFIAQAFANGALAAVVAKADRADDRPAILVENGKLALSRLAAAFAGNPSHDLRTIGITGTNGKTTIHWLLYHALDRLGHPGIRIGSLGISGHGKVERSGKVETRNAGEILMTTPGPLEIQESLRLAVDAGHTTCVLETSSHALHQHRVADVRYEAAIFTNLSPDHLNYHADMEEYFQTKVGLFRMVADARDSNAEQGGGAVNIDCPYGRRLVDIARDLNLPVVTFGAAETAAVRIIEFDQGFSRSSLGLRFQGQNLSITTSLIGDYNASNIAGALAGLMCMGFEAAAAADALSGVPAVPGRLESVGSDDIAVLVDYAHTEDGLRSLLTAVRSFVRKELWVVFGCGGGKDHGKRPGMGSAAKDLADRIVLTSDNPKHEDPAQIVEDILASGCTPEFVELDRATAIERTLKAAAEGDVVVLAGKGHEDYQIIGGDTLPFSDRDEALKWRERGVLER